MPLQHYRTCLMKTREAVRRYFNKYTTLSPVFHDYAPDQKRLHTEFDDRTLLRWDCLTKTVQVWYDAPSGLYCVFSIEPPCSIQKVIWLLKERQKSKRQALKAYQDFKEARERESDEKIAEVVKPTVDAIRSWSIGKLTTSGKGLCP